MLRETDRPPQGEEEPQPAPQTPPACEWEEPQDGAQTPPGEGQSPIQATQTPAQTAQMGVEKEGQTPAGADLIRAGEGAPSEGAPGESTPGEGAPGEEEELWPPQAENSPPLVRRASGFFRHPPKWFVAITVAAGIFSLLGVVWALFNFPASIPAYAVYTVALGLAVYNVITLIAAGRKGVKRLMGVFPPLKRFLQNHGFRVTVFTLGSLAWNLLYALYHAVLALLNRSTWLFALAVYYFALGGVRGFATAGNHRKGRHQGADQLLYDARAYTFTGAAVVLLGVTLTGVAVLISSRGGGFTHAGLSIYVFAVYTTQKVVASLVKLVKAKKQKDYTVRAIRNIGVADALVSILSLQTAMLAQFDTPGGLDAALMNAITSCGICLIVLLMGGYMIVRGALLWRSRYQKVGHHAVRFRRKAQGDQQQKEENADTQTDGLEA